MIPYIKHSTRNLLRPINTFNKGAEYKVNTEKLPSLYAINKHTEKPNREASPFATASKNILETNLT